MADLINVKMPREWVELWAADTEWNDPDESVYHDAEDVVIRACRDSLLATLAPKPRAYFQSDTAWITEILCEACITDEDSREHPVDASMKVHCTRCKAVV